MERAKKVCPSKANIYIAATTYGKKSSACIQGTWTQIINSVDEIYPALFDKFQRHLEEEEEKEARKKIITVKNIRGFIEHLADILIKHVEEKPALKEALSDFALSMVDVTKSEEITLGQQQILAKINQEFSSKIEKCLRNYRRGIPTLQEYQVVINEIANVPGEKIQRFINCEMKNVSTKLELNSEPEIVHAGSSKVDNGHQTQMLMGGIASPLIAVGIYAAVALSAGIVFNPVVDAGIFAGVVALLATCFAIVKVCEKINEEKDKDSGVSSCIASNGGVTPEYLKSSGVAIS